MSSWSLMMMSLSRASICLVAEQIYFKKEFHRSEVFINCKAHFCPRQTVSAVEASLVCSRDAAQIAKLQSHPVMIKVGLSIQTPLWVGDLQDRLHHDQAAQRVGSGSSNHGAPSERGLSIMKAPAPKSLGGWRGAGCPASTTWFGRKCTPMESWLAAWACLPHAAPTVVLRAMTNGTSPGVST